MSSKDKLLLKGDFPLIASPTLAQAYGMAAATFLQKLHYCLQSSDAKPHQGKKYWFHTYLQWQQTLGFYSVSTIKRVVSKLKDEGILIVKKLSHSKWLQTNYYTINYHKLKQIFMPQVQEHKVGHAEPDKIIAAQTSKQGMKFAKESLPKPTVRLAQNDFEGLNQPLTPFAPPPLLQAMSPEIKSFYQALRQQKVDIHYDDARIKEWLKYRNHILRHIAYLKQCGYGIQRYQWHSPEQLQLDRFAATI